MTVEHRAHAAAVVRDEPLIFPMPA
jgi:hypothetical protein